MRPLRPIFLALALFTVLALAACSSEPLVEIGDSTGAPEKAVPPARVLTNMSAYMDGEKAKVEAELTNKRGEVDGYLQIAVLGAAMEIELQVDKRFQAEVDGLEPGDDFIAYVTLAEFGDNIVLRVE